MHANRQIPSEKEWGDYKGDPDREYAHRIFFGKTSMEMLPLFEQSVTGRAEELRYMSIIPFRFYMLAFRDYLISKDILRLVEKSDAASCFLNIIKEKLNEAPDWIIPIMDELMPTVAYVCKNQALFDADINIYGDFAEKLAEIESELRPKFQLPGAGK